MTQTLDSEFSGELKALGARIRQARLDRGLSVRDMVIRHNYHDAQWRRYENGAALTLPSLMRIAKALGISLTVLLDGIGEYSNSRVADLKDSITGARRGKVQPRS